MPNATHAAGRDLEGLHQAASTGDVRAIAAWHERQQALGGSCVGISGRGSPPLSRTALHEAAVGGHAAAVALLLRLGCEPAALDGEGETALHLAAEAGYSDVVAALLAHSGSKGISVKDAAGRTVADCANGNAQVLGILTRQLLASRESSRRCPSALSQGRESPGLLHNELMRRSDETNLRLQDMEAAIQEQSRQNEYLRSCLTALATQLRQPLPPAPAPRDQSIGWAQRGSPAVIEADEGRVRLRLGQQQEVAFQELRWQERKRIARNSRTALVSPQPRNSAGSALLHSSDFGPGVTADSSAAPRYGSVRSSVGQAAAPQQPSSRRVPAPVRETPPAAETPGSLRRLWNQAPVAGVSPGTQSGAPPAPLSPVVSPGPGVSPVCRGRDARLLTWERQELERELEELRRLRDARGPSPSPLKHLESDCEEGMPEGVWTLEARIAQRQREIDAVILAEQLALGDEGEASELQHLLAAREAERLRDQRMLHEEAVRAAEVDSELRFAPHRRKLELMESKHQEAKRHNEASSGGGEKASDIPSPSQSKVADTSRDASPSTQPIRRDPADPVVEEVPQPFSTPRQPFPPATAVVSRSQPPWPPASATQTPTPRTLAAVESPPARQQGGDKVFLTRRERIAAGLAATAGAGTGTPVDGCMAEAASPYSQHAPPLKKIAQGIADSPKKPSTT